MKTMSAKDAKNGFGRLIDTARAEPVMIEKHGRGVVVVLAVEEFERLNRHQDSSGLDEVEEITRGGSRGGGRR
ncbi:type II toxin-antitoxin system Phd/YefM family antitoxin [Sneathiella sp.]|uniref:type II toxin-antitoxin system Phd/YefM family antitoxin n=1 Tax=Sneathiella sp. TaxID=1964365 RepID=UPI002FE3B8DA